MDKYIFLVNLLILVFYSYLDLRYQKIKNIYLILLLFSSLIVFLLSGQKTTLSIILLIWGVLLISLWAYDSIGGGDLKIIFLLIPIISSFMPNLIAGHIFFMVLFSLSSGFYGLASKKILKNKEIPFMPIITLNYILFYLFCLIW
jgi:leader peptidase (prepilin peptidase)/N-methyltransferase